MKALQKLIRLLHNSLFGQSILAALYNLKNGGGGSFARRLPIDTVLNYAKEHTLKIKYIEENEEREVCVSPKVLGEDSSVEKYIIIKAFPIYITELQDAVVAGNEEGIICGGSVLNDTVAYKQKIPFILHPAYNLAVNDRRTSMVVHLKKDIRVVDQALNLIGRGSDHWWHLHYEILPLIQMYDQFEEYRDLPLLICDGIQHDEAAVKLLECLNIYNHPIIFVPMGECVRVKKLITCSLTTMEMNCTSEYLQDVNENLTGLHPIYSPYRSSVAYIRECVLRNVSHGKPTRKIFIARHRNDRLINEDQVAAFLQSLGFEILYSDKLSFEEEIRAFAEAKILISTFGAALTNLIYISEGARVACIYPDKYQHELSAYRNVIVPHVFYILPAELKTETPYRITYELNMERYSDAIRLLGEEKS